MITPYTIHSLAEGTFTIDKTKIFVPFNVANDDLQTRPVGSLLVDIQPFCIVTPKDIILLDTGLGFSSTDKQLQIHANLISKGIQPSDVTKVLISHLHKDHAGGISKRDRFGNYNLAFENAIYYVQQKEFENAMDIGYPSYLTDEFACLENSAQVQWLNGDGSIDNFIHYTVTGGHSQYHQVFWIMLDNDIIFFGGDDAPQLKQMKSRFVAKYDFNGKKCMELRQNWWQKGQEENWTFLFYHDAE